MTGYPADSPAGTAGGLDAIFPASLAVPARVRSLLRFRLLEWRMREIVDDVLLIADELVANAVQSTPDRDIHVRFRRAVTVVEFAVWDSSAELPVLRPVVEMTLDDVLPDPCALEPGRADGGRGLHIVRALASDCGVRKTEPTGKWVWAAIAL
ncbi:ATP-binding protein [Actinomadura decatromicini]|uniref:ATP-binding protein n=2 Tax=Actinomadura decatromicini TaxID=2604572 RepID=A0A5D3FRR6_9ACTN|nr:ATP-binding protein [Actinomadura decatromicini]